MENTDSRLQWLLHQYFNDTISEEDYRELWQLAGKATNEQLDSDALLLLWEQSRQYSKALPEDIFEKRLKPLLPAAEEKLPEIPVYRPVRRWYGWSAAAVLVLCFAAGGYVWYKKKTDMDFAKQTQQPFRNDVQPGGNKAILTLADGTTIVLDSAKNGRLADQGNTTVLKVGDGQVAYNTSYGNEERVSYNTISTPYGGQYAVVLPDNSRVWLNAGSSLKFPTAFTGQERMVELKGEAYFEVAKNAAMPFLVQVGDMEVKVMGTHFNIMSYPDEAAITTTLVEGSVKVTGRKGSSELEPGQQAQYRPDGQLSVLSDADVASATAWRFGNFGFKGADIQTIMRQVSRWYNVSVSYSGTPSPDKLVATISRDVPVSKLLELLQMTGSVHFEIHKDSIKVKP